MNKNLLLYMDDIARALENEVPLKVVTNAGKILEEKEKQAKLFARQIVLGMRMEWEDIQNIGSPEDPAKGAFWHNWTYKAVTHLFFQDFHVGHNIGFRGYYSVNLEYAGALEVRFQALEKMMARYTPYFQQEVQRLYGR